MLIGGWLSSGPQFRQGTHVREAATTELLPVITLLTALRFFFGNLDFYVKIPACVCVFFLSWQLIQIKNNSDTLQTKQNLSVHRITLQAFQSVNSGLDTIFITIVLWFCVFKQYPPDFLQGLI